MILAQIGVTPLPGSPQIGRTERATVLIAITIWNHVPKRGDEPIACESNRRFMGSVDEPVYPCGRPVSFGAVVFGPEQRKLQFVFTVSVFSQFPNPVDSPPSHQTPKKCFF